METILETDEERKDAIDTVPVPVLNTITLFIEEIVSEDTTVPVITVEPVLVEPVITEDTTVTELTETVVSEDTTVTELTETVVSEDTTVTELTETVITEVETVITEVTTVPVEPVLTETVVSEDTTVTELTETVLVETVVSEDTPLLLQKSNEENLIKANEILNINKFPNNKLIFVYSAPKVGSTSIVSSMRLFGAHCFSIIHIHDEEMLFVLSNIKDITINEIILYNTQLGKDVYVIDVFRSPIERKISNYFEKIGSYHFNNTDDKVNTYNVTKVCNRFNRIFPHIANGDHFMDKYNILLPTQFDFVNKFLYIQQNGVKYIKLRLKDSDIWGPILTNIFGIRICITKDYETANKPIKDIYSSFKAHYHIPQNLLDDVMQCKYLNYYYSRAEIDEYYHHWTNKSGPHFTPFTAEQYVLYNELTIENSHIDFIQSEHYMDDGCICGACVLKRCEISSKLMRGILIKEKVKHSDAKQELIHKQEVRIRRVNRIIRQLPPTQIHNKKKDFRGDMNFIVNPPLKRS